MCVIVTISKRTSKEGADYFVFEQMGYYVGHGVEENGRWHDPNGLFAATPHGGEIGQEGAPALYYLFDGLSPDDPTRPLRQNASTLERLGFTGKTVPPNGLLSRFQSSVRPTLLAVSVAPITATVDGEKIASSGCRSCRRTSCDKSVDWAVMSLGSTRLSVRMRELNVARRV